MTTYTQPLFFFLDTVATCRTYWSQLGKQHSASCNAVLHLHVVHYFIKSGAPLKLLFNESSNEFQTITKIKKQD